MVVLEAGAVLRGVEKDRQHEPTAENFGDDNV